VSPSRAIAGALTRAILVAVVVAAVACANRASSSPPEPGVAAGSSAPEAASPGAPAAASPPVDPLAAQEPAMPPVLTTAAQIAAADGRVATLEGVYEKRLILKGMPRPGRAPERVWVGHVELRVDGAARDLVASAADGDATLDLGDAPREPAEAEALAGRRVRVTGRVVLSPPSDPTVASTRPRPRIEPDSAPVAVVP
jgi:hypothetical protein